VAVIKALTEVLRCSTQKTTQGLLIDLKAAADELLRHSKELLQGRTYISLVAGCELMVRYVTRTTSVQSADAVCICVCDAACVMPVCAHWYLL
jgi:hypothetical protein